jgi:hypothetical protein
VILFSPGICYITYIKGLFVNTTNHGKSNVLGNR